MNNRTWKFVVICLLVILAVTAPATAQKGGEEDVTCQPQPWLLVANGYREADVSVAGAIAGDEHADLLLVAEDHVPQSSKAFLDAKFGGGGPAAIYVIGGKAAVGDEVVHELVDNYAPDGSVVRLGGKSRLETAAQAAGLEGPCRVINSNKGGTGK